MGAVSNGMGILKIASMPLIFTVVFLGLIFLFAHIFLWLQRKRKVFMPFNENMLRPPGYSLREKLEEKNDDFLIHLISGFYLVGLGVVLAIQFERFALYLLLVTALYSYFLIRSLLKQGEEIRKLKLGLQGEEYCGQELNLLMRDRAYVFHDVKSDYGNIDHLVIAPAIIFTVETKARKKPQKRENSLARKATVLYEDNSLKFPDYQTSDPIEQSNLQATYIRRVLRDTYNCSDYVVQPVVALPGWFIKGNESMSTAVWVINPKRGKALRKKITSATEHTLFKKFVKHIAEENRTVPLQKRNTDPTAFDNHDLLFRSTKPRN